MSSVNEVARVYYSWGVVERESRLAEMVRNLDDTGRNFILDIAEEIRDQAHQAHQAHNK